VAQGQRGTRRACAIVTAAEQQIESLAESIDFLFDLSRMNALGERKTLRESARLALQLLD
jgi:hypothetical protein